MVSRQSSTSVPSAPSAPPPPPNFAPNQYIGSGNGPSIDSTEHQPESDSPYTDMGNPWAEAPSISNMTRTKHPTILRPGTTKSNLMVIPDNAMDVMKPGWSSQNTPRSSLDSERSRDFWESSDDEEKAKAKEGSKQNTQENKQKASSSTEDLVIPSPLQIRRKPVATSPALEPKVRHGKEPSQLQFGSNNPFRRPSSEDQQADALPPRHLDTKGKGRALDSSATTQISNTGFDNTQQQKYSAPEAEMSKDSTIVWQPQPSQPPPPPPNIVLPPIPRVSSPFSEQPPLILVSPKDDHTVNPWASQNSISTLPSPSPLTSSQKQLTYSSEDLLDRGSDGDGRISLGDELKVLPNVIPTFTSQTSQTSLLDDEIPPAKPPRPIASTSDQFRPPPGPPPSHGKDVKPSSPAPPTKPLRPTIVTTPLSNNGLEKIQEQRNETYQIKHFNWFDHRSGNLRTSSMLTQNKNGPCPLLALVNALILGAKHESQAALDNALRSREQVTLGLIIETLMDELLSSGVHLDGDLPDVDELNKFLMKLRTGMNMNPRFVQPNAPPPNLMDARNSVLHMPTPRAQDRPGGFEWTPDNRLYSAFGIETVHGWLPEPGSEALDAFKRSAQNYEDAQVVQFGEEELDYKLTTGGLTTQEQRLWEDIVSIKSFFQSHPTQLTPYGLDCIRQFLSPGSFAILFRNDHFSTIYKHPRDGKLYTLITDAGYAKRDEVIWESLVDISGQGAEFFSGDFQSVSHQVGAPRTSNRLSATSIIEPLSPQQQQEQHDADFAMALQLQEEEEQRIRQERINRQGSGNASTGRDSTDTGYGSTRGGHRGSASENGGARRGQGIPIPLRGNNSGTENRPLIPPRNPRPIPTVNRPSDALDTDAPPTYEEAARGKPYNPPLGSPLHPQSSASAEPSPYNSVSDINILASISGHNVDTTPPPRRPERRQSAYNENLEWQRHSPRTSGNRFEMGMSPAYPGRVGGMPGSYVQSGRSNYGPGEGSGGLGIGPRRRNEADCIVM